ncbi:uncharacterized protein KD926_000723 [Aspergillus affinis]|uniref:uncharacterized protein n=1 Tax=Aspergillus affinis TaxID=1070780 RepID=UPI0022FDE04A|nr:uncharacterized protein KD926_000723 [Aspergillus affinis]KAI9037217.1 hypothetical protein KD926_000723 [Aspergillus affinis]
MGRKAKSQVQKVDYNAIAKRTEYKKLESDKKSSTRARVQAMKHLFIEFCEEQLNPPDWGHWLNSGFNFNTIEAFIRWYMNTHEIIQLAAAQTVVKYFIMFCREYRREEIDYTVRKDVKLLVAGPIRVDYDLQTGRIEQPPYNIDDVMYTVYHLIAWCPVMFPTMRCIFQHNATRKMMASTTARPGTLIASGEYLIENDSLKWKDIELFMVKDPELSGGKVLIARVRHRLNKGSRNEGAPSCFTYTERNDNLGLCVIQDILTFAFLDDAFDSEYIKCPRDVWTLTDIPDHRLSTPIEFKDSIKDLPILRGVIKGKNGSYTTHPSAALPYHQLNRWERSATRSAGFKELGTLYKYRKGAADKIKQLDEHSRNRIMGHRQGRTFAHYVSVTNDTQSLFMETPARTTLLSLATHASITRDPSAPQDLTDEQKKAIHSIPEVRELTEKREELQADILKTHGDLNLAKESCDPRFAESAVLLAKLKWQRQKARASMLQEARVNFFRQIGNQIIEKNRLGEKVFYEPDTSRIQPERLQLAELEFKNRDVDQIDPDDLAEDRIRSLELRLQLIQIYSPMKASTVKAIQRQNELKEQREEKQKRREVKEDSSEVLQCPICLGGGDTKAQKYICSQRYLTKTYQNASASGEIFKWSQM